MLLLDAVVCDLATLICVKVRRWDGERVPDAELLYRNFMSDKPKTRHIVTVNVTVLAEDRDTAIRHVNAVLLTDPSGLKFADPIERWLVEGVTEGPSPWRSAKTEKPPMDGRPFFARDAAMEGNEEFATAVRWHPEKKQFVDAGIKEFTFTHWMPIPPI
jgi:hypothetical protein